MRTPNMFWWIPPLGTFAVHYGKKFRKPLAYAAVAAALYGAGVGTGWLLNDTRHAKAEAREAHQSVSDIINEANANTEQVRVEYREDLTKVRALEAERDRLRAENVTLQERITIYVPQGSGPDGGYLSNGAVGLLNDAASGVAAGTHSAAAPSSQEDTAPSAVSWSDFARYNVRVSGLYNDARVQCNALIDWVDEHIVQTQAR